MQICKADISLLNYIKAHVYEYGLMVSLPNNDSYYAGEIAQADDTGLKVVRGTAKYNGRRRIQNIEPDEVRAV